MARETESGLRCDYINMWKTFNRLPSTGENIAAVLTLRTYASVNVYEHWDVCVQFAEKCKSKR